MRDGTDVAEHARRGCAEHSLTAYAARLEPALFERFLERYRERLLRLLGEERPCLFPFSRILFTARAPSDASR